MSVIQIIFKGAGRALGLELEVETLRPLELTPGNKLRDSKGRQGGSDQGKGKIKNKGGCIIITPIHSEWVVPAKLVRKIFNRDYVDVAKLLKDNMEIERYRQGDSEGMQSVGSSSRRESLIC